MAIRQSPQPIEMPMVVPNPAAGTQLAPAATYPDNINVEALTKNLVRLVEEGGRAVAAYLKPREDGTQKIGYSDEVADAVKTLGHVVEYWYADPQRTVEMQTRLGKSFLDLFASASRRLAGEPTDPVVKPDPRDKRFSDPEWSSNQYFDFLKQAYLVVADWAKYLVEHADQLDPAVRRRAEFYMRQIVNAVSPSNFIFTNPELLRATLNESAENLVRGAHMLAEDIAAGGGELKIRQSDMSKFEVGRNLAITPGKVIYQGALMQLIQYSPSTERVLKRPLLIVPPWINKYYVLDLTPEKSFIKWCVDQGLTVFVISWINPDQRLAQKSFADYVHEGPLEALDVVAKITGEDKVNAVGYCVGGTLLAVTLAYMAAKRDDRIASATFLTTQVDFTYAGDLKVFAATEEQVITVERQMAERGYLEGSKMANAFNLLRSNDLIWPYVVNNYLKGETPFPFDLLYWNADATRMPAANHSYYLRNSYLENNITKGKLTLDNVKIDLKQIGIPIYNLATREDHIAPAKSVYVGSSSFGGPMRYVLSGSGHIAGVINPPVKAKYQYWTGDTPQGEDLEGWIRNATEHRGSWWPDWVAWIKAQDTEEVEARPPGGGVFAPIEDAPGSYVKVRS
ncbi:MAG TPA: class I poly(R)-hydroxyalkanoic acid synthase [Xanthobacteraceae bacterium]|nr:class I poly(R)-hydroxyalkanoic acid synthase [Xanthobacteraceae bacterium]